MTQPKPYKKSYYTFIYEISIFPLYLLSEIIQYQMCKFVGAKNLRHQHIIHWQNRNFRVIGNLEDGKKLSQFLQEKIKNEKFRQKILFEYFKEMDNLYYFIKQTAGKNLKKESNQKIWQYLKEFAAKYQKMYLWGWLPNGLESHDSLFSKYLQKQLKTRLKEINKTNQLKNYFSTLVTSTKSIPREKQEKDLLKIVIKIAKNEPLKQIFLNQPLPVLIAGLKKSHPWLYNEITIHQQKYAWLMFKYEGPSWDKVYLISLIKDYLKDKISPNIKLQRIKESKLEIKKLQKKYLAELKLTVTEELYQYLLFAQELMYAKEHQKDYLFQVYYYLDFLVNEAAARLHLSPTQFRHFLVPEMKLALVNSNYDVDVLNQRIKNSVLIYGKKQVERVAIGQEARQIAKIMFPSLPKLKVFQGETAAPGRVCGEVKIIQETRDIPKMKKGNIFVTTRSNPNLLPAMRLASAIVADIGGVTSHAAIIARELKIPAVVGVRFASMVLRDGDKVEVDAKRGIVRKF